MSTLLAEITKMSPDARLALAHAILDSVSSSMHPSDEDTAKLLAAIDEALAQVEAGQCMPHTNVMTMMKHKYANAFAG